MQGSKLTYVQYVHLILSDSKQYEAQYASNPIIYYNVHHFYEHDV